MDEIDAHEDDCTLCHSIVMLSFWIFMHSLAISG